ncbi:DUF2939 domain-containing protein [Methylomonas rapida]|uniref:DUF2939 domain-containing protein n=1 Tax=Methylomonas rapida TaxID=2963939 RepID=A0ABY7GD65_9GAMM|nr:DUF2939 domain-containing protein [Methylomonas rapida]WAR42917.1 DUF2939 domain-containing protein [Methylomonas rapida]
MTTVCPKCGYQRLPKDDHEVPDYQCPACGIVYEKFLQHKNKDRMNGSQKRASKVTKQGNIELTAIKVLQIRDWIFDAFEKLRLVILPVLTEPALIRQHLPTIAMIVLAMASTWSFVSPALFFKNLRETAIEKDASDLVGYIDFEKLRMNLKATLLETMNTLDKKSAKEDSMQEAGKALGIMMADKMIDTMVSPHGIKVMLSKQSNKNTPSDELPDFEFHYVDFNKAKITIGDGVVSLDRTGPFSWVMVGINLNMENNTH